VSFLPRQQIKALVEEGKLFPFRKEFDEANLGPVAYDLRLGEDVFISSEVLPKKLGETDGTVSISPGEFALLTTYEHVDIPLDLMGFIGVRFRYKLYGLINVSGFHVDPGFSGRLIFSVYNAGPNDIILRFKEPIFMIFFARLSESVDEGYKGAFKKQATLPIETLIGLRGASVSLTRIAHRIDSLESSVKIYGAILLGLFVALFGLLLSRVL